MKGRTILVSSLLLALLSFNYTFATNISTISVNSSLSFAQQNNVIITIAFNQQVNSFDILIPNFVLSNSITFADSNCTFRFLSFSVPFTISSTHILSLFPPDGNMIKNAIGNNPGIDCLSDINSTFLLVVVNGGSDSNFQIPTQLNVIPDLTPPQVNNFEIDFEAGTIKILFSEPIIIDTLNLTGLVIETIGSQVSFSLSNRTNSFGNVNTALASDSYILILEVFELPILNTLCRSFNFPCALNLPSNTSIVSDVFGNTLVDPSPSSISASLFNRFRNSDVAARSLTATPINSNQVILSFSTPINLRSFDQVSYRIYVFPEKGDYYRGNCDFLYGYRNQLDVMAYQIPSQLDCQNTTVYRCYITQDTSLIVNIFEGFDNSFRLDTIYPNIQFDRFSSEFLRAQRFFELLLNIEFSQDENGMQSPVPGEELTPFPLGNRALLNWTVPDSSFCDKHRFTIRYPNPTFSIDLDNDTVCGDQFVYVYLPNNGKCALQECLTLEIRITTPNDLLPNDTCAFSSMQFFGSDTEESDFRFPIDIPVIESITTFGDKIKIDWSSLPVTPNDYFNIYIFPVYALKYDGGSCNEIESQTPSSEFSFYPTEYYRHGTSIPNEADFDLTCPPNSNFSLPYECHSTVSFTRQITVNSTTRFALGIIVETVFFGTGDSNRLRVRSYPAIYSTWTVTEGSTGGATYQQYSWNPDLCHNILSSVLFSFFEIINLERRALDFEDTFHGNSLVPCTIIPTLIRDLPTLFEGDAFLYNDVQIGGDSLCLSGFQADIVRKSVSNRFADVVAELDYLNYDTLSLSIAIDGDFRQPAFVYLIADKLNSLTINSTLSVCPSVVDGELPEFSSMRSFTINTTSLLSMNPLPCVNTTTYRCLFVEDTFNLTLNYFPGFDHIILVNTTTNGLLTFSGGSVPSISNFEVIQQQKLLYTKVRLGSNNSIVIEWDPEFYCPPGSFMNIFYEVDTKDIFILEDDVTVLCQVGSLTLENVRYSSKYLFSGIVLFNSTDVVTSCPTKTLEFDFVNTPDFIQNIEIMDFGNLYVKWNSIQGISSYTLLAVPNSIRFFQDPIGSVYSPNNKPQPFNYRSLSPVPTDVIYQTCLNSSENLTCSRLSTSDTDAILPVIPGYAYGIVVAYEVQNQTFFQPESIYDPEIYVKERITTSSFNSVFLYNYSAELCTEDARTVFHHPDVLENNLMFRVVSCQNSTTELSVGDIPFIQPLVLFIFPYQEIQYPGIIGLISTPVSVSIASPGIFSFLPTAAAPVTTIQPPNGTSSDIYQAQWTASPSFPNANQQQFESYNLYALPSSRAFTLSGEACPLFIYPGCFFGTPLTPFRDRSVIFDLCPSSRNFYFCQEFSSATEGQIALFPLLDYTFFVESEYDAGLRAYFIEDGSSVSASQNLMESLNLTYQVTAISIEIQWDTSTVFCVDSTLAFLYFSQINPSRSVPCQTGNFSLGSLQPNTEYEVFLYFDYNPTRLHPGPDQCIRNAPVSAFDPFPVTSSFCVTQPCGGFGLCSEGFSNNSYHCDCLIGYEFDGNTCIDTNECNADINACGDNGLCTNTEGSFSCQCFEGYELVNSQCLDINECEIPDNCINGICTNLEPPANYRCECESAFEGRTCNISAGSSCPSFTESNEFGNDITFPATPRGEDAMVSCSLLDSSLFGSITKRCNDELEWEDTNFDNCLRANFLTLQVSRTQIGSRTLTPEESVTQSFQLASATNNTNGVLYPGEISEAATGLQAITNSLTNLTGSVLTSTLTQVQDNVVVIASNIFSSENTVVFVAAPQVESQSMASIVVVSVETLGTLLGSVLPVNSSLVIDSPNAALVVTVVNNVNEPLVIGPSSNPGNNQSALVQSEVSVSIPASVIQANDIGEGVEVSFSVFPNLAQILGEVEALVSLSVRETSVNDTLGTGVSSLNIFTRGGNRVEQLNEDILLTFGLIYDPPIIENSIKFRIVYSCVSSQRIESGWISGGTTLSNEDQVPPGPAQCNVSHLTNFAVLVSARSLNFSPQEVLALEILSYITGIISILFLIISIVSYIILWWRTRKQRTSLFKKDATVLHLNFAVSLLLALIFFMASAGAYENRRACLAMTIIQYYFWLAVFTASLSIGFYILLKIYAWNVERRFWLFFVLLSWSLPIPLLIITPSITHNYIIDDTDEICWLSNEPRYASLAFIIPMFIITSANLVFLIITAIVLFRVSKKEKNIGAQVRSVLFATFVLAPLLGIPWLFSIVASLPTPATAFIFTLVLGLQGVVFSILFPLRTPEIIKYVFLWKPVNSESALGYSSSNTGANTRTTAPFALKFRINRKADNFMSKNENIYSQAKPSAEAPSELAGIKLEPVTIESSMHSLRPNLKGNEVAKQDDATVAFQHQLSEPHYTASPSAEKEDFQRSLPMKLPYQSLS